MTLGALMETLELLKIGMINVVIFVEIEPQKALRRRGDVTRATDRSAEAALKGAVILQIAVTVPIEITNQTPVPTRRLEAIRRTALPDAG